MKTPSVFGTQMNTLNMVIPSLMHFCAYLPLKSLFRLKLECCRPHKAGSHQIKCDIIIHIKLMATVFLQKFTKEL